MDGKYFKKWFTDKLLPNIPVSSIVVMDNAPYHSAAIEKAPTTSTRKADIQLWLTKKGVPWSQDMVRAELLELSRKVNTPSIVYRINTLAAAHGHEVLRIGSLHVRRRRCALWVGSHFFVRADRRVQSFSWRRHCLET
ncbi:hypothetical protein HPB50_003173 [Hyalomma asiaticum]|uniref:Uncharacterized protein n=1 Tax=Hyalomma asiaticum TaxID=266040 RepID=A0ACB7RRY3_HYAAI|nr:hypothetical protein HPB50_003173 [Hyalomma asiaticum]